MKVLSLFDGISCARVALEKAGIKIDEYVSSEIDPYAMTIAQRRYPDTFGVGSIVGLLDSGWINTTPGYFDLVIGGSPCQDLSIAKKGRQGLKGERSGLFYKFVEIIEKLKPKYFILENVNSMPKEAKDEISRLMGVEPIMINAALVSAQNRKRLFWTNIPNVVLPEDRGILLKDILENEVDKRFYVKDKSNTIRSSGRSSGINNKHNWDTIRIGQVGSNVQGNRVYSPEGKSTTITGFGGGKGAKTGLYAVALRNRGEGKKPEIGGDKANSLTTVQTDSMVIDHYNKKIKTDGKAKTLGTNPQCETSVAGQSVISGSIIRKLTPIECERLQGLPDNYTKGVSDNQRYKMLGNAFNCDVVAWILSFIPK